MSTRFSVREGWFSFLLLSLLVFIVTLSLQAADWAPGLQILFGVALLAFLVGIVFAKSPLSGLLLHPLSILLGVGWTIYLTMGIVPDGPWEEELAEVLIRLIRWGITLQGGGTNQDTLPFVALMGMLIWLIAYGAAWDFYRARNVWGVLLPGGITILINTYYARNDLTFLFLLFLVLAFLFVIRATLLEKEERWQRNAIAYSADIHFDFMREGALFAVAVVAIAWLLPSLIQATPGNPALAGLGAPWGRAQSEWNKLFSTLNYRGATPVAGTWFGDSMSFRGPLNRTEQLIMTVQASQGRYWRAVVNDSYTSAAWVVTDRRILDGPAANQPLPGVTGSGRELVSQRFTMVEPAGQLLFAAGSPFQISLDTQVMYGGSPEDSDPSGEDLVKLYARSALVSGQSYDAVSAIPIVDIQSLRAAGSDYPAGLREHYTALPDSVPQRVLDRAQEIAGSALTPYDAASAVEGYLRSFPYDETIPGPNPGEDGVDYFLFREQRGYCDYYASSMAVMLRSLGVPARIARGYNQGTLNPETGLYDIRQTNAHTWVEVYFPGYGWIEFEPTASEPTLVRPLAPQGQEEEEDALPVPSTPLQETPQEQNAPPEPAPDVAPAPSVARPLVTISPRTLAAIAGTLAALALAGTVGWTLLQRRWRGLRPVERLYDQASIVGRALGLRPDPSATPNEFVGRLGERVPSASAPLQRLAGLFNKQRFSQDSLADAEQQEAEAVWLEARRPLMREVLRRFRPAPRADANGRDPGPPP